MKYFKDENNTVYAYEADGSQESFIKEGLIPITKEEAFAINNPPPTPEQLEAQKKQKKSEDLSTITVTTSSGNVFDGDDAAIVRMLAAISASDFLGVTTAKWKLADNTVKNVHVDEVKEALALSIQRVGEIVTA